MYRTVKIIALMLLVLIPKIMLAQDLPHPKNALYAELGGNGLLVSLHFEKQVFKNLNINAGLGIYGKSKSYTIPIGLDYNLPFGKKRTSYVDFGMGLTYCNTLVDLYAIVDKKPTYQSRNYSVIPTPSIQYKFIGQKGFLFKSGLFLPILEIGPLPYIGFSFGYAF